MKRALLLALVLGAASGCTLLRDALELPDKAIKALSYKQAGAMIGPVELQSLLIRYADQYIDAVNRTTTNLTSLDKQSTEPRTMLGARVALTDMVLSVATGANTYVNLLDMISLATINRLNVEHYWIPERYGDSGRPMLLAAQYAEKEIWRIAKMTLSKKQVEKICQLLETWEAQHPKGRISRDVGFMSIVAEIAKMNQSSQSDDTNIFSLLMIDPLSELDPATRELVHTRMAAERALFLGRHMPTLMRWETELLAVNTAELPQVENLVASSRQISASAERLSQVAENLPATVSSERAHIVAALNEQRPGLISLAAQSEKTMTAGKLMSAAANDTLKTFQDLWRQMEPSPSAAPNPTPFRISDYTAAVAEVNATAQQLTNLLAALDQTVNTDRLDSLTRQVETSGKAVVDYAFNRLLVLGATLLGLTAAFVLLTSLAFWSMKRKFRLGSNEGNSFS